MNTSESTPRKTRWDDSEGATGDPPAPPSPNGGVDERGGSAAGPAVDSPQLARSSPPPSGAYIPPPMDAPRGRPEPAVRAFSADVDINHSANRQALAKGATHRIVTEATDAEITTRGRYFADSGDATPVDPALHLHVEAADRDSLDRAVAMIERMKIDGVPDIPPHTDDRPGTFSGGDRFRSGRTGSDTPHGFQDKVFLEVESERGFNVRAKLIGTGGENMKYIQSTTGARVQVRGRGSGYSEMQPGTDPLEPMHLLVMADSEDVLNLAREYSRSLVDTVHAQYNEFKDGGGRRHDRHGHRDGRGRHGHHDVHQTQQYPYGQEHAPEYAQHYGQPHAHEYAQAHPHQAYQQQSYPEPHGQDGQPPAADAAAAYNEYAAYCAQYYQYYGMYPDYSAYYGQVEGGPAQHAHYQQQQQQQPATSQLHGPDVVPDVPGQDGYHSVPPPTDYSSGRKV
ncbi:hypothetical protein LPJ61_002012 [Coemansia biformis]|uniref:K Homology domain-containing protein n=1 Tax=Coemansia biformis TaxID=1286918 RepID=A0A9W8CZJ6_9FUNG|nr:hypothetical protein LPJ61_002012 [Coemansia biformis]